MRISVALCTFNGEEYLENQLTSILNQTCPVDEIIICDDNSTDNTISIVNSYIEEGIENIILIQNKENIGTIKNFEKAIDKCTGDIIFLSDQDDLWLPNKVKSTIRILKNNDFVVTDCKLIDENENVIAQSFYENRNNKKSLIGNLLKFGYLGCCFAFRKEILQKALPFPPIHKYCTHDNWLMLVAISYYRYCISDKKMILYRRHENNASDGGFGSNKTLIFKFKYRIYLLHHILLIYFK